MKKLLFFSILSSIVILSFGQKTNLRKQENANPQPPKEESIFRQFLFNASRTRINKDWSLMADFRSGTNETVQFFPVQAIDLKTNEKMNALEIDMLIKPLQTNILQSLGSTLTITRTAWVGLEEIDDFIDFVEKFIVPNIKQKFKEKSSEYIFKSKELTFKFLVDEKGRRLTISINNYDFNEVTNSYFEFWTEAKVDNIDELLPILKKVKSKNLEF